MEKYTDSPQAAKARALLIDLGPKYAKGVLTTPLFDTKKEAAGTSNSGPKEPEAPYDEPEEPAKLRVSDSDKDAKPISESP